MRKILKVAIFVMLFMVGIVRVNAEAFNIGEYSYVTLKEAVADVPTDGTETLIEMTEDVTLAPGVQVKAGQNIVIDFGGHTYETWEPMVGSNGTETQSFQLLKGSTVKMKNGTLVASTHELSKMFIQNYADLTLENITIDARTNTYDYFYGVSSNNGVVNIIGNTSIYVNRNTHARAFDMCWAPIVGKGEYNGGTQMTVNTTGTISGIIELDVWGSYTEAGGIKSTLNIKNMNFDGVWEIDSRLKNQLTIEGGSYKETNTIDLDEYVVSGYIPYKYGDSYDVLTAKTATINETEINITKGETYDLNISIPSGYEKYATIRVDDTNVATLDGLTLTGVAKGNTTLIVSLGRAGASLPIIVTEKEETNTNTTTSNDVSEVANELIDKIIAGEEVAGVDEETKNNIINAILDGAEVETDVEVETIKESELDTDLVSKIKAKAADGEIAGYLNIDIVFEADGEELGKLTKLPNPVKITVDVDNSIGEVPSGVTRKYYVVRIHEGEEPELIEATFKDGKLSFETDRFSTYAYGYTDVTVTNPKTNDALGTYIAKLVISLFGLALIVIKIKKEA